MHALLRYIGWLGVFLSICFTANAQEDAQTFFGEWRTSLGGTANAVAADPLNATRFYVAFQARKLQGDEEFYSVLGTYNCRGQIAWQRAYQPGSVNRSFRDMAIGRNGGPALLHRNNRTILLDQLRPNGDHLSSYGMTIDEEIELEGLIPSSSNAQPKVLFANGPTTNVPELAIINPEDESQNGYCGVYFGPSAGIELSPNQLILQTGSELRAVDLSNNTIDRVRVPEFPGTRVSLSAATADTFYVAFSANNQAHLMKWSGLELQWYQTISFRDPVDGAQCVATPSGVSLMLEARGPQSVAFANFDSDGNLITARAIEDADFQPEKGAFDLDLNGNWLYCGSERNTAANDYTARLNDSSPCAVEAELGVTTFESLPEPLPQEPFLPQSWTTENRSGPDLYSDFPPENRSCIESPENNLDQYFSDTIVRCDTVLEIFHELSENVRFEGELIENPVRITDDGTYRLEWDICNTTFSESFSVEFTDCTCNYFLPNIFTPNGDGINDTFAPEGECAQSDYQMRIYDRWGNIIFETTNPYARWDGTFDNKESPAGVYVYLIRYVPIETGEEVEETGTVTLIR